MSHMFDSQYIEYLEELSPEQLTIFVASSIQSGEIDEHMYKSSLNLGLDVNSMFNGMSLLNWAVMHKRYIIVELLLKDGADVNNIDEGHNIPIILSMEYYSIDIFRLLMKYNVNIHVVTSWGWTPLHWAANYGYEEVVEDLLEAGANVNACDHLGRTPHSTASIYLHPDTRLRLI